MISCWRNLVYYHVCYHGYHGPYMLPWSQNVVNQCLQFVNLVLVLYLKKMGTGVSSNGQGFAVQLRGLVS